MAGVRQAVIRAGLETLYFTGAHELLRPFCGGVGVILTLHHVCAPREDAFQPNHILEITPEFLDDVVSALRRQDVDLISLDEVHRRLTDGDFRRRFVSFTFDDAYYDHREHVLPIMRRHGVPFTVFVPTSFPDRRGELWWLALEAVIARAERISLRMDGEERRLDCATVAQKYETWDFVYWWLRGRSSNDEINTAVRDLAVRCGVDMAAICQSLCMPWDQIAEIAADPLVTIGAHTVNHPILAKLPEEEAVCEMSISREAIEAAIGIRPLHLAYPVGQSDAAGPREFRIARELGFKTAVTTRPGVLFPEHRDHLCALPRVSLNGEFQHLRHVQVLMSGAATAMWSGFKRVDAA